MEGGLCDASVWRLSAMSIHNIHDNNQHHNNSGSFIKYHQHHEQYDQHIFNDNHWAMLPNVM
jgi:hypothetical protein